MEKKDYDRQVLLNALGEENLKILPINYSLMEPETGGNPPCSVYIHSKFHQTALFCLFPFYKPISKIPIDTSDESK